MESSEVQIRTAREIPTTWQIVPLSALCEQERKIVDPTGPAACSLPYIGLEHIEKDTGRILRRLQGSSEDDGSSITFAFDENHVLYGKLRPYLNKVAVPNFAGRCTTEAIPLRPRPHVDRNYLAWLLRRPETVIAAMREKTGSRMPRADMSIVLNTRVPCPPLAEQKRIAAILDRQMEAVARAGRATAAVALDCLRLREALFREAFCGIVPVTAERKLPASPAGWSWHLLTDIARLESGHTPSRFHPEWWGGEIPWIALPDIRALDGKTAYSTTENTNEDGIANSAARVLPAGTVVLSRTASVGFVTIMGRPMATSQDFVNWVCGDQLVPEFLALALRASRRYLLSLASGAVHKTIYVPTVKAFRLCAPPIAVQRQITQRLQAQLDICDRIERANKERLNEGDRMSAALLRAAFRGEL